VIGGHFVTLFSASRAAGFKGLDQRQPVLHRKETQNENAKHPLENPPAEILEAIGVWMDRL